MLIAHALSLLLLVPGAPPKPQELPADPTSWLYPQGAIPPVGLYESLPDVRDWGVDPATVDFSAIQFEPEADYDNRATTMIGTLGEWISLITGFRDRLASLVAAMGLDPDIEDFDTGLSPNEDDMTILEMAEEIAGNPPLAVQGAKEVMSFDEEASLAESLAYNAARSSMIIPSQDLMEAVAAYIQKRKGQFKGA